MNTFLTVTAMAVGLPIGRDATADVEAAREDFWDCAAEYCDDIDVDCID